MTPPTPSIPTTPAAPPADSFPISDWQFWVVTAIAIVVVVLLTRGLYRTLQRKPQRRMTLLTVDREPLHDPPHKGTTKRTPTPQN